MRFILAFFVAFSFLVLSSCSVIDNANIEYNPSFAIPIINSKLTVQKILNTNENFEVKINEDKTITVLYKSELINQKIGEILPPISSVGEIPILDSISSFPLETGSSFSLIKAVLKGDEMRFRYSHNLPEDVLINMQIPELTKDGIQFEQSFLLQYQGETPFTSFTESVNLQGYEYASGESILTLKYDARNPAGDRIILDFAAMSFNTLEFGYGEGYFGRQELPLMGQVLKIGIFESWKSGILEFENPRINFSVDHSYGFPIALRINNLELTSINDISKALTGINVGQEQILDYPLLDEVDSTKNTNLYFDTSNSNISQLFNEKVKKVSYDVDAIINPSGNENVLGFVTENSFFSLDVSAEIPLSQRIDNLVIRDTLDINLNFSDYINTAEIKIVAANAYPTSINLKLLFLDSNNNELFSLFDAGGLFIEQAELLDNGQTNPGNDHVAFVKLEEVDIESLRNASKIVVEPRFNSGADPSQYVKFFEDQFLELRVGLIINQ